MGGLLNKLPTQDENMNYGLDNIIRLSADNNMNLAHINDNKLITEFYSFEQGNTSSIIGKWHKSISDKNCSKNFISKLSSFLGVFPKSSRNGLMQMGGLCRDGLIK